MVDAWVLHQSARTHDSIPTFNTGYSGEWIDCGNDRGTRKISVRGVYYSAVFHHISGDLRVDREVARSPRRSKKIERDHQMARSRCR